MVRRGSSRSRGTHNRRHRQVFKPDDSLSQEATKDSHPVTDEATDVGKTVTFNSVASENKSVHDYASAVGTKDTDQSQFKNDFKVEDSKPGALEGRSNPPIDWSADVDDIDACFEKKNANDNRSAIRARKKTRRNRRYKKQSTCREIQVSRKKNFPFYFSLARKFFQTNELVELSGMGLACSTVIILAELICDSGYSKKEKIRISNVKRPPQDCTQIAEWAKIQIWLRRSNCHLVHSNEGRASQGGDPGSSGNSIAGADSTSETYVAKRASHGRCQTDPSARTPNGTIEGRKSVDKLAFDKEGAVPKVFDGKADGQQFDVTAGLEDTNPNTPRVACGEVSVEKVAYEEVDAGKVDIGKAEPATLGVGNVRQAFLEKGTYYEHGRPTFRENGGGEGNGRQTFRENGRPTFLENGKQTFRENGRQTFRGDGSGDGNGKQSFREIRGGDGNRWQTFRENEGGDGNGNQTFRENRGGDGNWRHTFRENRGGDGNGNQTFLENRSGDGNGWQTFRENGGGDGNGNQTFRENRGGDGNWRQTFRQNRGGDGICRQTFRQKRSPRHTVRGRGNGDRNGW